MSETSLEPVATRPSIEDWRQKLSRGLAVFPAGQDKDPAVDPRTGYRIPWQDLALTLRSAASYAWPGTLGAVKCGKASNNLECADFDNKETGEADRNLSRFKDLLDDEIPNLYERLYIERTRSGGYHLLWYSPEGVEGNQVLAKRLPTAEEMYRNPQTRFVVTIETRGEGGYVIVAPAPGYHVVQGELNTYPVLTGAEREAVIAILRSLDQFVAAVAVNGGQTHHVNAQAASRWRLRPGDDFNKRGREVAVELLRRAGWVELTNNMWRRPGKTSGVSATLDYIPGVFYPFSSNAEPFNAGQPYDYFGVYTMLAHKGDFAAASAELLQKGFGKGLPRVVQTGDVGYMVRETWRVFGVSHLNEGEPQLYRSLSGGLCVWRINPDTWRPEIVELNKHALRLVVQSNSYWCKIKEDKGGTTHDVPSTPPDDVLSSMLSSVDKPLPALKRVTGVPVFVLDDDRNPRLVGTPGYDEPSALYYYPSIELGDINQDPSRDDMLAARNLVLNDLFVDFPFADAASRAHAVALFLLPYVRGLIDGPTPFHLVDAPVQGSGKGLCVQAALGPYVGNDLAATAETEQAEEWRKRLIALAMSGSDHIWVDNITRDMDWAPVALALTSQCVRERLLGTNDAPTVPLRVVWAGTANNAAIGEDMTRRIVYIRLNWTDRGVEDPARVALSFFKHPNLLRWVQNHRADLVRAAITLCLYGLKQRRPSPVNKNSFEDWADVIGSILVGIEIDGFLSNEDQVTVSSDHTTDAIYDILSLAYDTFGGRPFTSKQISDLVQANPMIMPSGIRSPTKYIGKLIAGIRDRSIAGFVVNLHKTSRASGHEWIVRKLQQ